MVLLRRSVRKIQFVMANIKNSLWTEPLRELIFAIFAVFRQNRETLNLRNTIFANFIEEIQKTPRKIEEIRRKSSPTK